LAENRPTFPGHRPRERRAGPATPRSRGARALGLAGLLLLPGCSESLPPPAPRPAAERPVAQLPTPFAGAWRVVAIDGRSPPAGQSPIELSIGAAALGARADCAYLAETRYAVAGGVMTLTPRPDGPVSSCTRGLSDFETAFNAVVRPGAVGRLRGDRLIVERGGRTVEAVRGR
jgi:hypothetical protein